MCFNRTLAKIADDPTPQPPTPESTRYPSRPEIGRFERGRNLRSKRGLGFPNSGLKKIKILKKSKNILCSAIATLLAEVLAPAIFSSKMPLSVRPTALYIEIPIIPIISISRMKIRPMDSFLGENACKPFPSDMAMSLIWDCPN